MVITKVVETMYKCINCGHIFDEGEQADRVDVHPYGDTIATEHFSACPVCNGDFESTHQCDCCDGEFLKSELIGGFYCKDCLQSAINFDRFLEFATSGVDKPEDVDTLEDFVFTKIFGLRDGPVESGHSLKAWCAFIFTEAKRHGVILMKKVFEYMNEDSLIWENFAEYLHTKEVGERRLRDRHGVRPLP